MPFQRSWLAGRIRTRTDVRLFLLSWLVLALLACFRAQVFSGQGAGRMLYTAPNTTFIEQRTGETLVTVNDASGSISTLQTSINNARAANPTNVIVIRLLKGATYLVSSAGLVLGSDECLVAEAAIIQAASGAVAVPLVTIASGATRVSVAGGTLNGNGANINGIYAPAAARVNLDKVIVQNCGQDCILLKGNGNSTYDNEMTVTRCEVSGSPLHAGISIQNSTQTIVADNNCHDNLAGIDLSCAWATVANNTCHHNAIGIDVAGGNDNALANNTCNFNGTGIHTGGSNNMITSNSMGNNSSAGINSNGSSNTFVDNLFTAGNAVNFISGGSGNRIVAYKTPLSASGQNYFYPPLIDDQHTDTVVNGMGRTDLTIASTTIATVQSQYDAARAANPNNVIVLHLNGTFTVGSNPLLLSSNACVLLNGTIQINGSTTASSAISDANSPSRVSMSGGIIDGGNLTGNQGIQFSTASMLQVDAMTLRNFGPANPRSGGSDVIHFDHGSTPYIVTRCFLNGGSARGIWLQLSGVKSVISDNEVSNVNQDGVDCDSSTSGCVAKFNYCHDLVRYGVFIEQSASQNLALGNICNNDGRDINLYNNSATPRGATQRNTVAFNWCYGSNGIRNGSTGTNVVVTSHNFLFNNTVVSASILSELEGTENYYSQNYHIGTLTTSGSETFFNSPRVSTNLFVQDGNSGLAVLVQNAATTNGAPIVIGQPGGLGNDQWALIPTDNGYYQIKNRNSGLVLNVSAASTNSGALIIQWPFGSAKNDQWMPLSAGNGLYYLVNRLSGLCLEVPGGSTTPGTQLDQQPYAGLANQQVRLNLDATATQLPFFLSADPTSRTITVGRSTNYTVTLVTNTGFSGPVTFALSGLPANASGGFTPPSLSSGSSILTVATMTNTPVGNYTLTVLATNGAGASNTLALAFIVTTPGSNLVWNSSSSTAWDTTSANWFNEMAGTSDLFQPGKNVLFTDRPGVVTNVIIGSGVAVAPGSTIANADTTDYLISGAGKITGGGGMSKTNAGTLMLATVNDYTGITTISGGIISVSLLANGGTASGIGAAASDPANLVLDGGLLRWTGGTTVSVNRGFTLTVNPESSGLDASPTISATLTVSGSIAFSGLGDHTLTLTGTDPNPLVIGGNILSSIISDGAGGQTAIVKNGNTAWNLSGANTFSGGAIINAGRLRANTSANAFGTGPVTVTDGGQAYCNVGAAFPNAFFIEGIGIPETEGNYGALRLAANGCIVSNTITLVNDARITARGATGAGATISGQIIGDASLEFGNSGGGAGNLTLANGNNGWSGNTVISHGTVKLGAANAIPHGLDNGNVTINNSNPTNNSVFDLNGVSTTINGLSSAGNDPTRCIVTNSSADSATLTVGDSDANGVFGGIIKNGLGTVALAKIGSGTQTLSGNNTYTGPTTINGGTVVVNGAFGSSAVTVMEGGTLGGTGVLNGPVIVNAGAAISPGNSIGVLTISNAVTLQGTTFMELNKASGTNDLITGSTSIAFGGTLQLTNLAGALAAGDPFKLFSAVTYSRAFLNVSPPMAGPGLVWDTSGLVTNGILRVATAPNPVINSISLSSGDLLVSGTNGVPNASFYLLASTNLAAPLAEWVSIATNVFNANGTFSFTTATNRPQQFFRLKLP